SSAPLVPDLFGLGIDGPLARTVADAALLLDVMTGNRDGDMYTLPPLPAGETFLGHASRDPGRLRIGRSMVNAVEGADVRPDCVGRGAWKILNDFDVVLTPARAQPPVPVGWCDEVSPAENFERQKQFTPYAAMYNVTGQPAVNLPLYWAEGGLPIGVMVAGPM